MAGKPKKKAKQFQPLQETAENLFDRVEALAPSWIVEKQIRLRQGKKEKPPSSELEAAWFWALDATEEAAIAMEELGDLLREAAGVTEPEPVGQVIAEEDGDETGETKFLRGTFQAVKG